MDCRRQAPRFISSASRRQQTDRCADTNDDPNEALHRYQTVDGELAIVEAETGSVNQGMVYGNRLWGYFDRVVVDEGHNIKVCLSPTVDKLPSR
jgi:hypothetical protein